MSITPGVIDLRQFLPSFHEHNLPSNGKIDTELPAIVHIRGLTVKELKHLTASGRLDKKVFDNCIRACVQEPIDIGQLTIPDYNFIVYMVRVYTSGTTAKGKLACEECRKIVSFDYDISECSKITLLDEMAAPSKTVDLPRFKKEYNTEVSIEVRRLLRKDMVKIETSLRNESEIAAKQNRPVQKYPLTELLKAYVVSIEGLPNIVDKEQLLDILTSDDAQLLTNAFDDSYGVDGSVEKECPICHHVNTYEIPFTDLFFQ